jgi:hypothetical protein
VTLSLNKTLLIITILICVILLYVSFAFNSCLLSSINRTLKNVSMKCVKNLGKILRKRISIFLISTKNLQFLVIRRYAKELFCTNRFSLNSKNSGGWETEASSPIVLRKWPKLFQFPFPFSKKKIQAKHCSYKMNFTTSLLDYYGVLYPF